MGKTKGLATWMPEGNGNGKEKKTVLGMAPGRSIGIEKGMKNDRMPMGTAKKKMAKPKGNIIRNGRY